MSARPAASSELADVAATLAVAFLHDPVLHFILRDFDDAKRLLLLTAFFGARLAGGQTTNIVLVPQSGRGCSSQLCAALWEPPGTEPDKRLSSGVLVAALGNKARERLAPVRVLSENRPKVRHYYLAFVGTRAEGRRRGYASAVIAAVTRMADQEGLPCYLESSNPRNVPLYERHGFETMKTVYIGDGTGVPVPLMWRDPKGLSKL